MTRFLPQIIFTLLLVIFCGVVFHAPLSVGLGSLWPELALPVKAWKELLLLIVLCLLVIDISRQKRWHTLWQDWLVRIAGLYALLHIVLLPFMWHGVEQTVAGLMIDLRFIAFFVAVYVSVRLYPTWRKNFLVGSGIAAALSMLFALLQVTVLPHDVLSLIGYSKDTIAPYLTVDQNYDFIRINGTLRGPNPLGIYAGMVIVAGVTVLLSRWRQLRAHQKALPWVTLGIVGAAGVALWFSYSRSAILMAMCALMVLVIVQYGSRITRGVWLIAGVVLLVAAGGLYAIKDSSFVSNVILHEDPEEGGAINSNDGHRASLVDGATRMIRQPFGAGIGSTGSPSLTGKEGLIIENHYLYVAHETGWLGLVLFMVFFCSILQRLWVKRQDWLAISTMASGIGIAVAAFFLPVWADDTVAMIWWGLAGIAVASEMGRVKRSTK